MLEGIAMAFKLSQSAHIKHDEASGNYHLFCVDTGKHVQLNRMSHEILRQLKAGKSQDEISRSLCRDYEVDTITCQKDIADFFQFLSENGFICA